MTVLAEVVMPVLQGMTMDGEVDRVSAGWVDGRLVLELTLRGERMDEHLWAPHDPPWSAAAARQRFASGLQDFIAESAFGWGQLREWSNS